MTGRSNWEFKNSALDRLDPARRAEAEARAKARAGVDNEAIKTKEPTEIKAKATPGLLGTGAAAGAARAIRGRKAAIDDAVE